MDELAISNQHIDVRIIRIVFRWPVADFQVEHVRSRLIHQMMPIAIIRE